jgi:cytochrome bd ubiquinol oxidase subunit I
LTDPLFWHRLQFGFTIAYHYLFPQLTMGLGLLLVLLRAHALRTGSERTLQAARFWTRVFGINFAVGVVTGIPMEFQFGTNWSRFSLYAGGVIGQALAMEGMIAFFLESSFLGLVLYGEERLGKRLHFLATLALWLGSWLSGYFIVATNAFMQHPVGHQLVGGRLQIGDLAAFLFNPWALVAYAHTMSGAVVTGAFFMAGTGAFWLLSRTHEEHGRLALRLGVWAGLAASVLQLIPTADWQAKLVARHQPATLAAMEGVFKGGPRQGVALIGQPDVAAGRLDNPIEVPRLLSMLAYGSFEAPVKGLDDFPADQKPDNIELLYYSYHVMAGLGTLFIALMGLCALLLLRGRLFGARPVLWLLLLATPFPYVANTAGWLTAELGRQPWLVYGLFRTAQGSSPQVGAGDTLFSLLGFAGLYLVVGIAFLGLLGRELLHGPGGGHGHPAPEDAAAAPTGAAPAEPARAAASEGGR